MTLAQVNTAIETILSGGQSFSVDGVTYTQASLGALNAMREKLMTETGRSTRPVFRAMSFRSMGYGTVTTANADIVKTVYP